MTVAEIQHVRLQIIVTGQPGHFLYGTPHTKRKDKKYLGGNLWSPNPSPSLPFRYRLTVSDTSADFWLSLHPLNITTCAGGITPPLGR